MNVTDMQGAALDWAVAKCEKLSVYTDLIDEGWGAFVDFSEEYCDVRYTPTENWGWGGAIIEREKIGLDYYPDGSHADGGAWGASTNEGIIHALGPTALIAAMRCYVLSKIGEELEVPKELQ